MLSASSSLTDNDSFTSLLNEIITMPGNNAERQLITAVCFDIVNNRNQFMQSLRSTQVRLDTSLVDRDIVNARSHQDSSRHTRVDIDNALAAFASIGTYYATNRAAAIVQLANYALGFVEGILNYPSSFCEQEQITQKGWFSTEVIGTRPVPGICNSITSVFTVCRELVTIAKRIDWSNCHIDLSVYSVHSFYPC